MQVLLGYPYVWFPFLDKVLNFRTVYILFAEKILNNIYMKLKEYCFIAQIYPTT